MDICVFGAASNVIDDKYISTVENLCTHLAKKGHNLVFGAGRNGLMGAAARGFKNGGGKVTGVVPTFFSECNIEELFEECDELIYTDTMRERKAKMEELSQAFIIVPGGVGTFEEMFEVITLKQLGRHTKPIAIYNINSYYTMLEEFLDNAVREGFIREKCHSIYRVFDSSDDIDSYLTSQQENLDLHDLKNG